jgi:predicted metal-binding membrane protein
VSDLVVTRRLLLQRPELGASIIVVAAWLILVVDAIREGMMGVTSVHHMHARVPLVASLRDWVVMTIAMMGPAALGAVRHVGVNTLLWRRDRAIAEFATAYLPVWMAYGAILLVAIAQMPAVIGWSATSLTLALAAAWQLTPWKRRWLRDCHRSVPLPPRGWSAEIGSLRFGLRLGTACLGSCWCLMLVMALVPSNHLLWTAALTGVTTTERLLARPRQATRLSSLALTLAAITVAFAMLFSSNATRSY